MRNLKKIPKFKNEDEEREFWSSVDTHKYFVMGKKTVFPNLNLSTKPLTIRMPVYLIDVIKSEALKRDVPYQSLIKIWLSDKVRDELTKEYIKD